MCDFKLTYDLDLRKFRLDRDSVKVNEHSNIHMYVNVHFMPRHRHHSHRYAPTHGKAKEAVGTYFLYCQWPGLPTIWNSLPHNVISAASLSTFRQHQKTFLFQALFPDINIDPC